MPSSVTTNSRLSILAGFVDEDDRTVTVQNPRDNLTEADIIALNTLAANVLIGDKFGARFSAIKKATRIDTTRHKFTPA